MHIRDPSWVDPLPDPAIVVVSDSLAKHQIEMNRICTGVKALLDWAHLQPN